jgi:hypothetical protein
MLEKIGTAIANIHSFILGIIFWHETNEFWFRFQSFCQKPFFLESLRSSQRPGCLRFEFGKKNATEWPKMPPPQPQCQNCCFRKTIAKTISTEDHMECSAKIVRHHPRPELFAMQSNDTPGVGLEVGPVLAEALALGLTLAVTWNTHGIVASQERTHAKTERKPMGTAWVEFLPYPDVSDRNSRSRFRGAQFRRCEVQAKMMGTKGGQEALRI